MKSIVSMILAGGIGAASCSVIEVDVGRNANPPESRGISESGATPDQPERQRGSEPGASAEVAIPSNGEKGGVIPDGGETAVVANPGTAKPAPRVANAIWGKCYPEGADYPDALEPLCATPPEHLKELYQVSIAALCTEKHNLDWFCAEGGTLKKPMLRYHVLAQTDANDPGRDFYSLMMNAITVPATGITYTGMTKLAYTDREAYSAQYEMPKSVTILPDGNPTREVNGGQEIGYRFSTSLSPSRFDGKIFIWQPAEGITYLFNYADSNLQSLNKRAGLSIIRKLGDGREHVVSIDERDLPDLGLHAQFRIKMKSLDTTEITTRLKNMELAK